jgi:hypothetical protein
LKRLLVTPQDMCRRRKQLASGAEAEGDLADGENQEEAEQDFIGKGGFLRSGEDRVLFHTREMR